jgi:hypothetical protein
LGEGRREAAGWDDRTTTSGVHHLAAVGSTDRSTTWGAPAGRRQGERRSAVRQRELMRPVPQGELPDGLQRATGARRPG